MATEISTGPVTEKSAKAAPVEPKKPPTRRIILEENDLIPPTGLFVGDNGVGYLLCAGEEMDVPLGVLEILSNAKTSVPQVDPQSLQVLGYREKLMYPYRIV